MNIAITLTEPLWKKILSGEKKYECRKRMPRNFMRAYDRVYVILKGTNSVVGYFWVEEFLSMSVEDIDARCLDAICVDGDWFKKYAKHYDVLQFWKIRNDVHEFPVPKDREAFLGLFNNPQSYTYCRLNETD